MITKDNEDTVHDEQYETLDFANYNLHSKQTIKQKYNQHNI